MTKTANEISATRLARLQRDIRDSATNRSVEARERFLDKVNEVMEAQGITRAELARRLGKGRAYVTHLLGGGRNFSFDVAVEICHALGQTFSPDVTPSVSGSFSLHPPAADKELSRVDEVRTNGTSPRRDHISRPRGSGLQPVSGGATRRANGSAA